MGIFNKITKAFKTGSGPDPSGDGDRKVMMNTGLKDDPPPKASVEYNAASVEQAAAPICDTAPPPKRTIKPIIEADETEDGAVPAEDFTPQATGKFAFIKNAWNRLDHRQRQWAVIISVLVGFFLLVVILVSSTGAIKQEAADKRLTRKQMAEKEKNTGRMKLFSERVERDLWVKAEGLNVQAVQRSNEELKAEIEKIKASLAEQGKLEAAKAAEEKKTKEEAALKAVKPQKNNIAIPPPPMPGTAQAGRVERPPMPPIQGVSASPGTMGQPGGRPSGTIRTIEDELKGRSDNRDGGGIYRDRSRKEKQDEWLSTGSFMKAVLLNGIDAPTSGGAQAEPYPVLMSIVDLTTLPNRFKVDMRECFVIGAGYGNLSDERAYIRTERLSCVRKNGQAVDFDITGHIIGEDGKLGVRGRLVSKQGQQIAMALFAGTLGGFATAMKPTGTVKLDIGGDEGATVNRANVGDVLASAGLGGAGSALDRIAQYFLKMAEKLFPVIEIDAGRTIEVVILKGRSIGDSANENTTNKDERKNNDDFKAKKQG